MHLGNKSRDGLYDWSEYELQRIDPGNPQYGQGALWPSMIVVISEQIYIFAHPQFYPNAKANCIMGAWTQPR